MRTLAGALGCAVLISASSAEASTNLTFAEFLQKTQQNSLSVQQAEVAASAADARREVADYEDRLKVQLRSALSATRLEEGRSGDPETLRQQSHGLTLSLPLIDFGKSSGKTEGLSLLAESAKLGEKAAGETIHFAVARAWLAAQSAVLGEQITESQLRLAKSRVEEQTRLYRQGMRPESDLIAARVELGRAEIVHQTETENRVVAKIRLATMMGDTASWQSVVVPPLANDVDRVHGWFQESILKAEAKRTSSLQADLERRALDAELGSVRAELWPQINAEVGLREVGTPSPMNQEASGQIALTWEIPWHGMNREQRRLIELERKGLELKEANENLRFEGQWWEARQALETARRTAEGLKSQVDLVQRQKILVEQRYAAGRATALELSAAETALLQVQQEAARVAGDAYTAVIAATEAKGLAGVEGLFKN